jgi:hypothetical protein
MAADTTHMQDALPMVGRKIFADDWIGWLTDHEQELIRFFERHGGPCPVNKRAEIERALGRRVRLLSQRNAAYDWLLENGPTCTYGFYDTSELSRRLESVGPTAATSTRGRGRGSYLRERIAGAMQEALGRGQLTAATLRRMPDKDITQWGGSVNTAKAARDIVLAWEVTARFSDK